MPHIHEKIDFTVDVFVVYRGRVLLRLHDKYKLWLAVGGHVELDEEPMQAAVREVKEEVGLDVKLVGEVANISDDGGGYRELLPPRFMNIHPINPTHQHIGMVYFARSGSDEVKPSGSDVSNDWRWLTLEDLEKNELGLSPAIRHYAMTALKEVGE